MEHQHGPQCRHGHGEGHSHGHGHSHGVPSVGNQMLNDIEPTEYFTKIKDLYKKNKLFFWSQFLSGQLIQKIYQKFGLDFMKSCNCQIVIMLVMTIQMFLNFDWMPLVLRPFSSAMFFPMVFLFFMNFNVVVGLADDNNQLKYCMYATAGLYILIALRGSGTTKTTQNKQISQKAKKVRPYLQNPQMHCQACQLIKSFRATHCPVCQTCIPKFTRHSAVFGICIGAANELLSATEIYTIFLFVSTTDYGFITQAMFLILNIYIAWASITQFFTLLIFNIIYGITEQQIKTYPFLQYLMKAPMREFENSCDQGFLHNLTESIYALLSIPGFQLQSSDQLTPQTRMNFPMLQPNKKYIINWDKAFFYLVPQMPSHKSRNNVIQIMKIQQPKMIETYQLQQKFRQEVLKEASEQKIELNQFQIQQKTMMKLQAHMMRNMPQMMMGGPQGSTEQQKAVQLQMLSHLKRQLATKQPQFAQKAQELQTKLKEGVLTPIEVNLEMRKIQNDLMGKKMQEIIKQRNEAQQAAVIQKVQKSPKIEEQEESLKKQQIPDQDL